MKIFQLNFFIANISSFILMHVYVVLAAIGKAKDEQDRENRIKKRVWKEVKMNNLWESYFPLIA